MELMHAPAGSVSFHPVPFAPAADRLIRPYEPRAGQTVREIVLDCGIAGDLPIVISLDDRLLTVAEWDAICPRPGQLINVQAAVAGGDDSNPLAIVASIALMVYAPMLGAELYSAMGGTFVAANAGTMLAISTAVVSVAGNMVIGALFKPSAPNLSSASGIG